MNKSRSKKLNGVISYSDAPFHCCGPESTALQSNSGFHRFDSGTSFYSYGPECTALQSNSAN